jgi:hypothetical protein
LPQGWRSGPFFFIVHLSSLKREADMEDLLFAGINRVEQLDSGCGA